VLNFIIIWDEEDKDWSCFDHSIVQILVLVANSHVRTMIADVRKGFLAIVLIQELVDLKTSPKWSIRENYIVIYLWLLKRKQVKILVRSEELDGVVKYFVQFCLDM